MNDPTQKGKTLYLHLGIPKTGTSAIQFFLVSNNEALEQKGYCYRRMPFRYHDASMNRNGHFLYGLVYGEDGELSEEIRLQRKEEGFKILEQWLDEVDNVLLSDEGLWNGLRAPKKHPIVEELADFCAKRDVTLKIIVYVRRQDEYTESLWKQRIKKGRRIVSWDVFVPKVKRYFNLDYWKTLRYIEKCIGKGNVIVRRYDREGFYGGSIEADFLHAVGLEMDETFHQEPMERNLSLTNNFAEIKRVLNELLDEGAPNNSEMSRYFEKAARRGVECSQTPPSSLFSDEEREAFMERYQKSNRKVAEHFFGEDEELFPEKKKDQEPGKKWSPDNPHMYEDMTLMFGDLLWSCGSAIHEQREIIRDLQRRLDSQERSTAKLAEDLRSIRKLLSRLHKVKSKMFGKKENS